MSDEETTETPAAEVADAAEAAAPEAAAQDDAPTTRPARKVREGLVVSNGMDKTAVVVARDRVRHRRYNKTVQRDKRLYVHDANNEMNVGDRVRVEETRPLSKKKRWRLLEILEQAR